VVFTNYQWIVWSYSPRQMQGLSQISPLPWSDPGTETPPQVPFPGPASPPLARGAFFCAAIRRAKTRSWLRKPWAAPREDSSAGSGRRAAARVRAHVRGVLSLESPRLSPRPLPKGLSSAQFSLPGRHPCESRNPVPLSLPLGVSCACRRVLDVAVAPRASLPHAARAVLSRLDPGGKQ